MAMSHLSTAFPFVAYFNCRIRNQIWTRIPVTMHDFSIGSDLDSDLLIKLYVTGMEIVEYWIHWNETNKDVHMCTCFY